MATVTAVPDAVWTLGSWVNTGGAANAAAALADSNDATYDRLAQFTTAFPTPFVQTGTLLDVDLDGATSVVLPAGAQLRSAQILIRTQKGATGQRTLEVSLYWPYLGRTDVLYPEFTPSTSVTDNSGVIVGLPTDITQTDINSVRLQMRAQSTYDPFGTGGVLSQLDIFRAQVLFVYNERPVTTVTAPTEGGTTTTSLPTVSWTYSDPESDVQERYRVRIFTQAQYTAVGFDADVTTPYYDSGEQYDSGTSHVVTDELANGVYRAYVKTADVGSGGRYSLWDHNTFTVSVDQPARSALITLTDQDTYVDVTLMTPFNLLTYNQSSFETDTSGWTNNGNTTLTRTTSAGTFSHGVAAGSMASVASGDMSIITTPASNAGIPVVAGQTYSAVASLKAATAGRSVRVEIRWFDAASAIISTAAGANVTDVTTGFIQGFVTGVAPANAVAASVIVRVLATAAAAEVHYVDRISFVAGRPAPDGLRLPGSTSHYASTPDVSALDITGDICLIWYGALADWTPATETDLIGKWNSGSNQRGYLLVITTTGRLQLFTSPDGTTVRTNTSSVAPTVTDGAFLWVAATRNATTGIVTFYTSSDGITWTQLGTTVASTVEGLFSNTQAVEVGSHNTGALGNANAIVRRAKILNDDSLTATAVFDVDFTDPSQGWDTNDSAAATGTDETGKTVTINGASSFIVGEWSIGGFTAKDVVIERSTDEETWTELAYSPVTPTATSSTTQVFDYEAPYGTVYYRARLRGTSPVTTTQITSNNSGTFSVSFAAPAGVDWYLKDVTVDDETVLNLSDAVMGPEQTMESDIDQAVFAPVGRSTYVTVNDQIRSERFTLNLEFTSRSAFDAFELLRNTKRTLLLQRVWTSDQWYVQMGTRTWTILNLNPTIHRVSVPCTEVAAPVQ